MRRFSLAGLATVLSLGSACSLLNAPADIAPGAGGAATTGSSSSSAGSSSTSSGGKGGGSSSSTSGTGGGGGGMMICGITPPATITAPCAKCVEDSCCAEAHACAADPHCVACLATNGMGPNCDTDARFSALGACVNGPCDAICNTCSTDCGKDPAVNGPCSQGVCQMGTCVAQPINESNACDDGLYCTVNDRCASGVCTGDAFPCAADPTQPCMVAVCDEMMMTCGLAAGNDGGACDDGDPCTIADACGAGACAGTALDCSAYTDACNTGFCKGGDCEGLPVTDGTPCDTTNTCAMSACTSGKCAVTVLMNTTLPCDDGQWCTTGETCSGEGYCGGGSPTCVKPAACIDSTCDEAGQKCDIAAIPNGSACDDGDACSGGETCTNNVCNGGSTAVVYFSETFSAGNAAGWSLGTEWQIGPAQASVGGQYGADPDTDNTPTPDNMEAGVVIGGNEAAVIHAPYWLTSPAFNVPSDVSQKVFLTYYRWLNSDYAPYMRNIVSVWSGASWVEVWSSAGPPGVQDSPPVGQGWTFESIDITPYANPALQVRFGYEITGVSAFSIGSWNLDDVKVQSAPCPK